MNYFDLFADMSISHRWYLGEIVLPDGREPVLDGGKRARLPGPLSTHIHHPGPPLDFCLSSFNVPVASKALARAVELVAGDDVQCFDLHIPGHPGHMVLNSTRALKVVNEQHSEFSKWKRRDHRPDLTGTYHSMTRLTLRTGVIPPRTHFFRVRGWEVALIVSEELKVAMEAVGCRGATFTPLPMV